MHLSMKLCSLYFFSKLDHIGLNITVSLEYLNILVNAMHDDGSVNEMHDHTNNWNIKSPFAEKIHLKLSSPL